MTSSPADGTFNLAKYNNLGANAAQELVDMLGRWSQGDLLQRPPMTWIGPCNFDRVTGLEGLPGVHADDEWEPVNLPEERPRYGIITSQTCDIGGMPGRRIPVVQVSPVVNLDHWSEGQKNQVAKHKFGYLYRLTAADLDQGFWAADLRISVPISKAFLVRSEPLRGFGTDQDVFVFAEKLAYRSRRAALHPELSERLPESLTSFIKSRRKGAEDPAWLENVTAVRLRLTKDDFGQDQITVIIITRHSLPAEDKQVWRDWHTENQKTFAGFSLLPLWFGTEHDLSAYDFRTSTQVRIDEVGPPSMS